MEEIIVRSGVCLPVCSLEQRPEKLCCDSYIVIVIMISLLSQLNQQDREKKQGILYFSIPYLQSFAT